MNNQSLLTFAHTTIENEANAIHKLNDFITEDFASAVQDIYKAKGRTIITGVGKSAIIAQKIVATFNSTGTPAIFMHAADAIHGDLGIIMQEDIVVCISKSGDTPEIKVLVPFIQTRGNKIIAITSNRKSFLGLRADFVLHAYIER